MVSTIVVLHNNCAIHGNTKANVTLKLDADLQREARIIAAEQGRPVSALLAERLESLVRERRGFERARRRALSRLRQGLDLGGLVLGRAETS